MNAELTPRLESRLARDFPASKLDEARGIVSKSSDSERVQAAIVIAAEGSLDQLRVQADLASVDWRDVLMNGGLANADWAARLDSELGSA